MKDVNLKEEELEKETEKELPVTDREEQATVAPQSEKKLDMESLIEKGKKGKLSADDLDEAMEEMDFDAESLDKLYETLEDNGIAFEAEMSTEEINKIVYTKKNCGH